MMQEVEVLKTIQELICSFFSEEQFTLSGKGKLLTFELKNGNISFVATCSAGVAELADAHDSKSCG